MNENDILGKLYDIAVERKNEPIENSYTNYLFEKGLDKILKKVGEETTEVIVASKNDNKQDTICEIADLLYHLSVLMAQKEIKPEEIAEELDRRHQKSGNKKAERKPIENF
ncbi:MAG: phosphoribosyl-ATP diphosphatase [Bacillota bacterium]|nr:phosphoribosyl-ATP diphosphatase [Bacillota bacterium]